MGGEGGAIDPGALRHDARGQPYIAGRLLLGFHRSSEADRARLRARFGLERVRRHPRIGVELVRFAPEVDVPALARRLEAEPLLKFVELDGVVRPAIYANDLNAFQWNLENTGQRNGVIDADIDAPDAWDSVRDCGSVVVAVVDTGIELTHPDLKGNLWVNRGEVAGNSVDDDGNGFVDDVTGWNFHRNNNAPTDDAGHGTHIAGVIGAQGNNGQGVAGICWSVQIMPVKTMAFMWGATSDVVAGLTYAIDNGADIINASFSGRRDSPSTREAIRDAENAGVLVSAAAGNESSDNDMVPYYPASYGFTNVISVAATTRADELADFSNYGASSVDLAAPGDDVYSTLRNGSYGVMSGTSMAAPHVSGAAAMLLAIAPELEPDQIRTLLMTSSDTVTQLDGRVECGGRLNLRHALDLTASTLARNASP